MIKQQIKGFTLIELIIVITILAILATIGFMSFQSYTADARDANRTTSLKVLSDGLNIYKTRNISYPMPDNPKTISVSGTTISYQGEAGTIVLSTIKSSDTKDPMDENYYTYIINENKNSFQLMGYLENPVAYNETDLLNQTYARDYSSRIPKIIGDSLGILLDSTTNTPITTNIDLFLAQSGTTYKAIITDKVTKTLKGVELGGGLQMLSIKGGNMRAPSTCEAGYIGVPGNPDFMQPGFCVAKYEMSYADATIPDSTGGGTTRNTMHYTGAKMPVSQAGLYPIADITQQQSIDSCALIGGHLITNNEWMTIARNIEQQGQNWSTGLVGSGYIYTGLSTSTMGCNGASNTIYTLPRTRRAKTGEGSSGTGALDCDTKRRHILSNGKEIYDISGNVREHVNKANTIDGNFYNAGQTTINGTSSGTNWDDDGKYDLSDMLKYGSIFGFGIANGMGRPYYGNGLANNIFIRGATASGNSDTGIFTLHLYWLSFDTLRAVGFRCAK